MAERAVTYLSTPRDQFQEHEIEHVRNQARFYGAFLKDDPFYILIPCCWNCSSEDLIKNHSDLTYKCQTCDFTSSMIQVYAGRIAIP